MQCFAPCFAPEARQELIASDRNVSGGYHATDSTSGRWREPEVHVHHSNASSTLAAGSQKAAIKAAFGARSSSSSTTTSSSTSQQAAVGKSWPRCSSDSPAREQLRQEFLMQHGRNIMAVSTLQQEGLKYFVIPGVGYIAYALMFNGPEFLNKRTAVGLSDPVCDPQHYHTIAAAFLQRHPQAMFAQVSAEFAAVLEGCGFTVNSMGGETRLDLATYNFTGYARRGLRSAITGATKEGVTVQEVMKPTPGSLGEQQQQGAGCVQHSDAAAAADAGYGADADWARVAEEMQVVDAKWAASKGGRASDFWFINRRPIFAPEAGVRKFIARDASGNMQGYIFFDGVFEGGRLVGYYANVTRMLPDAHPGTLNLMMKTFIETARSEASLAAPARKLSVRRSQRKKQAAAAAAAVAAAAVDSNSTATADTATTDQQQVPSSAAGAAAEQAPAPRPQFLSLGLSPFYQMDSSGFTSCPTTHKALQKAFEIGEGFYPFKTLAAAKAKYGAGLHDGKYEDAAVEYRHTYLCHRRGKAALVAVFDMAKLFGLWKHPADALTRLLQYKIKAKLAKRRSSSSGSGCDSNSCSSSLNSKAAMRSSSAGGSTLASVGSGLLTEQLPSKGSKGGAAAAAPGKASKAAAAGAAAAVQQQKSAAGAAAADSAASGEVSLAKSSRVSLIGTVPAPLSVDSSNRQVSSEGGSDAGELGAAYTGISSVACSEITVCTEGASPTWSSRQSSSSS